MTERQGKGGIIRINRGEYSETLPQIKHGFLVGNLQKPSPNPFIRDERVEFILCDYQPGDDGKYHWHREITEYELVLEGKIGYLEVATGETHWLEVGDLGMVPPELCVRRLVPIRTRTVTIKVPSRSEKVHCSECDRFCSSRVEPYININQEV